MTLRLKLRYTGIRVADLDRSIAFYRKLGFRVHARFPMDHGGIAVHLTYPRAFHRLELNWYPKGSEWYEPPRKGTELDHIGFHTNDVVAWAKLAKRAGARVVADVPDGPNRLVYVRDPDGVWLEAFGPAPKPRTRRGRKRAS